MDSSEYIKIIYNHFISLNIKPLWYVDEKTTDDTVAHLLACAVAPGDIRVMLNSSSRISAAVEYFSLGAEADWVLRFDCDELPSVGLLNYLPEVLCRDDLDMVGFPRRQCIVSDSGALYAHTDHCPKNHRQWRLYRAKRVHYTARGHTPGFETRGLRMEQAPDDAFMIHLDWSLHSYDSRREKIGRYDAHTPGHGSIWRSYYLFEELGFARDVLERIAGPEFEPIARDISRLFPERCVREDTLCWPQGFGVTVDPQAAVEPAEKSAPLAAQPA